MRASADPFPARSIDLDPADWFRAPWRKLAPLPRPDPPPFDRRDCAARVGRVTVTRPGLCGSWAWGRAEVPPAPSRAEARFWLEAMTRAGADVKPMELGLYLERQAPGFDLTLIEIKGRLRKKARYLAPEVVAPLAAWLSLDDLVSLMLSEDPAGTSEPGYQKVELTRHVHGCLVEGFARYVLPYLSAAERDRVRAALPLETDPGHWPKTEHVTLLPVAWRLAALVGMSGDVLRLVSQLTAAQVAAYGSYGVPRRLPGHDLVFGLGSARLVRQHTGRLGLRLETAAHVRAWLAHTEYDALDFVRDGTMAVTDRTTAGAIVEALGLVKAPETAPIMLELRLNSRGPAPARRWLDEQVPHAVAGLVPIAAAKGPLTAAAIEYLRAAQCKGHGELLEAAINRLAPEDAARLRREVQGHGEETIAPFAEGEPRWWARAARESLGERPGKPPAWADPVRLPPLVLGNRRLNDTQAGELVLALRKSPPAEPLPLVREAKRRFDPPALEAFAWRLFELWLAEGGPAEEKWALHALGLLGADAAALKLPPLIRDWPRASFHQRAVWGLECLRAIGSDTALIGLHGIAQRVKFKGLRTQARRFMSEIAAERGLSQQQLEDRIVPDLGLDERGGRTFDYGPRQFRLVFGPDLKPMLRDEQGKPMANPPRANAKDDAAKVAAAAREWQLLKKQVSETLKVQVRRLERAMLSRRRWSIAEFERFLVRHPLMSHLARRILWGDYSAGGALAVAFRVSEDQTYADVNDRAYTPAGAAVGVVHPVELSDEERARWGEVFADYEIIQPFPQLGRRVHRLRPGEEKWTELTRFSGAEVPSRLFNGILKSHDWVPARRAAIGLGHQKHFPEANVTAIIRERGGPGDTVRIESALFVRGSVGDGGGTPSLLRLGRVDPVVLSEVLGILAVLASKAQ